MGNIIGDKNKVYKMKMSETLLMQIKECIGSHLYEGWDITEECKEFNNSLEKMEEHIEERR